MPDRRKGAAEREYERPDEIERQDKLFQVESDQERGVVPTADRVSVPRTVDWPDPAGAVPLGTSSTIEMIAAMIMSRFAPKAKIAASRTARLSCRPAKVSTPGSQLRPSSTTCTQP
jgi:hypothetical protein